jgi:hypothetical protein
MPFKRLTADQTPPAQVDVNMSLVTYLERFDGYTRLYFSENHKVDVKETPDQIKGTSNSANLG